MVSLPHTNTVILQDFCCCTITEPVLPVVFLSNSLCLNCWENQERKRGGKKEPEKYLTTDCRASDRSQKKSRISRDFWGEICGKIGRFHGNFRGKLRRKAISTKRLILWLFSAQISLEITRFFADQTSVFNFFLTEVIIWSFTNSVLQK